MSATKSKSIDEETVSHRRAAWTASEKIKDLELAGEVEGATRAGSAGGPGEKGGQLSCDEQCLEQVQHRPAAKMLKTGRPLQA